MFADNIGDGKLRPCMSLTKVMSPKWLAFLLWLRPKKPQICVCQRLNGRLASMFVEASSRRQTPWWTWRWCTGSHSSCIIWDPLGFQACQASVDLHGFPRRQVAAINHSWLSSRTRAFCSIDSSSSFASVVGHLSHVDFRWHTQPLKLFLRGFRGKCFDHLVVDSQVLDLPRPQSP